MRVPDSKIAEVAAATDIVQVISEYVDLKRAGKDFRGLCPFHGDKDPSFYVSPQKGIFHCFGCQTGGSVFSFLMKMENVSFVEAIRTLARRYGVPFQFEAGSRRKEEATERILKAVIIAQEFFSQHLASDEPARQYLAGRDIPSDWIERAGFGFAPNAWDTLTRRLRQLRVRDADAVSAGLVRERPKSGGYYDYFRSRITIPIHDLNGRVVAFGGRILGDGEPKYLNSPESAFFRKKGLLFGLNTARDAIKREGCAVLVEGYFDQLSLRIRGVENVVAPLGTALGREQVRLIRRFTNEVITVFDADEAGIRAVKRALPLFLAAGIEPRCLLLSEDKDPDDAVRRLGTDAFRKLLDRAGSMIDFLLNHLTAQYDVSTLQGRNMALEESLPVLREIADSTERDYLIERVSSRINVREDRIRRVLGSQRGARGQETRERVDRRKSLFDFPAHERIIVRGMLLKEGFIDRVLESGIVKDLKDPLLRKLAEMMVHSREESGSFDSLTFSHSLEDQELAATVAAWMHPSQEEDDIPSGSESDNERRYSLVSSSGIPGERDGDTLFEETLERIQLRRLEERKAEIQARMRRFVPDEDDLPSLMVELDEINRTLHKIGPRGHGE